MQVPPPPYFFIAPGAPGGPQVYVIARVRQGRAGQGLTGSTPETAACCYSFWAARS